MGSILLITFICCFCLIRKIVGTKFEKNFPTDAGLLVDNKLQIQPFKLQKSE
jgi:hypothetical protein